MKIPIPEEVTRQLETSSALIKDINDSLHRIEVLLELLISVTKGVDKPNEV